MANDIGGVWRTIGGRRVFIKEGQDLASAMKESGKFKSAKKFSKREELKKDIAHQVTEAEKNGNTAHAEAGKRELERLNNEEKEQAVKDYENGKISAEDVLNKFYGQEDKMKEVFEKMGYTAPTKENIDRANENARKRAEERKIRKEDEDDLMERAWRHHLDEAKEKGISPEELSKQKTQEGLKRDGMLAPIDPYKPEDEARKILGLDSKNQKSDLMTAEQLKGKDREEQKEINKQYLKEQNKLAQEKNKKNDNQFTMYNSQYDKEVTVKKGADGKWVDSDGNKYMGYLSKQDVKQYFKGNWKESTEKRTASEIISSQMSKTKNAKIEVANALGLKYDNDNGWKSTSQLYKEQKGKDIANIAIESSKADKYNAFVKKNYNREDKNFSDRADIDKYAKDNNLDADALYYMTKIASESDRTKLKKKAFELYKKQHPNTKKTIYSFEDDIK